MGDIMNADEFNEVCEEYKVGSADIDEMDEARVQRLQTLLDDMTVMSREAERIMRRTEYDDDSMLSHVASRGCAYKAWANLLPLREHTLETSFESVVNEMSEEL